MSTILHNFLSKNSDKIFDVKVLATIVFGLTRHNYFSWIMPTCKMCAHQEKYRAQPFTGGPNVM